jgi:hypothetical protein
MLRIVSFPHADGLSTHFEKHERGVDFDRADGSAELTEAAFEWHPLIEFVTRIIGICYLFWFPVLSEKGALLLAKLALDAFPGHGQKLLFEMLIYIERGNIPNVNGFFLKFFIGYHFLL